MRDRRLVVGDARVSLGYLMAGLAGIVGYYLVPARGGGVFVRIVVYLLISSSAAVMVWWGVIRHRPRPRLPWLLLGWSQAVYATADCTFYVAHYVVRSDRFPSFADVLYLAHYPLVVAALVLLVRRRTPRDLIGLLDALVIAVAAAMLSWLFLIGPTTRHGDPMLARFAELAYPVMDLALLAAAIRLIMTAGSRPVSFVLLTGNLLGIATADTIYSYQQLHGLYRTGNFLDAIWLAGNLALGAAACHPSMARLAERATSLPEGLGGVRFAALAGAALLAPAILLVQYVRGTGEDIPAIAAACGVLFLLTLSRMAGLVAEQRRLAITDGLTGLATRRFIEARLPLEVARASRGGGVGLFIIDVDHFKSINDRYGHPAGDRVLIEIASRLREATGPGDVLARYGGEEFAVLVPGAGPQELHAISERLRTRVGDVPVNLADDTRVRVTVSVGTASYPAHAGCPQELVAIADRALYAAKLRGRDRVVIGSGDEPQPQPQPSSSDAPEPDAPPILPQFHDSHLDFLHRIADEVDVWLSSSEHSHAISRWTTTLALTIGCSDATTLRAGLAGRFHDIGKVVIPRGILVKADPLTEQEWQLLREHPAYGARLAVILPELEQVAEAIRQHHERFDGTGYPDGRRGLDIRQEARLIAVCDAWAAMRSDRPYQVALSEEQARDELRRGRGTQFDPDVVDAFLRLHEDGVVGELRRIRPAAQLSDALGQPAASSPSVFQNISS